MKNTIFVVLVVVAAIGGYWVGQSGMSGSANSAASQDSIAMMKKQSASIQQMSELMKSSGMMMQELGAKYQNGIMISKGKDLEVIGKKYMDENASASGSGAMKQMMGN